MTNDNINLNSSSSSSNSNSSSSSSSNTIAATTTANTSNNNSNNSGTTPSDDSNKATPTPTINFADNSNTSANANAKGSKKKTGTLNTNSNKTNDGTSITQDKFRNHRLKIDGLGRANDDAIKDIEKNTKNDLIIDDMNDIKDDISRLNDIVLSDLTSATIQHSIVIALSKVVYYMKDEFRNCHLPLSQLSPLSSSLKRQYLNIKKHHDNYESITNKADGFLKLLKLGSARYRLKQNRKICRELTDKKTITIEHNDDNDNNYDDNDDDDIIGSSSNRRDEMRIRELTDKISEDVEKETDLQIILSMGVRNIQERIAKLEGKLDEISESNDAKRTGGFGFSEDEVIELANSSSSRSNRNRRGWATLQRACEVRQDCITDTSFVIPSHLTKYWPCCKHVAGFIVDTNIDANDTTTSTIEHLYEIKEIVFEKDKELNDIKSTIPANTNATTNDDVTSKVTPPLSFSFNSFNNALKPDAKQEVVPLIKVSDSNKDDSNNDDNTLKGLSLVNDDAKEHPDKGQSNSKPTDTINILSGLSKLNKDSKGPTTTPSTPSSSSNQVPASSTSSSTSPTALTKESMHKILTEYYTMHDPKRLDTIPSLLDKYVLDYPELLSKFVKKYGPLESLKNSSNTTTPVKPTTGTSTPSPIVPISSANSSSNTTSSFFANTGSKASSTPSPTVPASSKVESATSSNTTSSFFVNAGSKGSAHTPFSKQSASPTTSSSLFNNSGISSPSTLNMAPPKSQPLTNFSMSNQQTISSPSITSPYSMASGSGLSGISGGMSSPSPFQTGQTGTMTREKMVEILTAYYTRNDPEKLDKIPNLILKYATNFGELLRQLKKKYGDIPLNENTGNNSINNAGTGWSSAGTGTWGSQQQPVNNMSSGMGGGVMNIMKTGSAPLQNYNLQQGQGQGQGSMTGQVSPYSQSPSSLFNRSSTFQQGVTPFANPSSVTPFANPSSISTPYANAGAGSFVNTFNRPSSSGTASPFQSTSSGGINNPSASPFVSNTTPLGRTSPVTSSFYNQSPQNNSSPFLNVNTSMTSNMGNSPFIMNNSGMVSPLGSPFNNNNNMGQPSFNQPSGFRSSLNQPSGFGQTSSLGNTSPYGLQQQSQSSGFGQQQQSQLSGFGQQQQSQSSGFGQQQPSQLSGFGQTSPLGQQMGGQENRFGSGFGQPSSLSSGVPNRTILGNSSMLNQSNNNQGGRTGTASTLFRR